jgi:hypothetical protein
MNNMNNNRRRRTAARPLPPWKRAATFKPFAGLKVLLAASR